MKHVISLELDELDISLVEKLKKFYGDSRVHLTIILRDDTDYLLSSEANREALMRSIEDIGKGNLINPNLDQLRNIADT